MLISHLMCFTKGLVLRSNNEICDNGSCADVQHRDFYSCLTVGFLLFDNEICTDIWQWDLYCLTVGFVLFDNGIHTVWQLDLYCLAMEFVLMWDLFWLTVGFVLILYSGICTDMYCLTVRFVLMLDREICMFVSGICTAIWHRDSHCLTMGF